MTHRRRGNYGEMGEIIFPFLLTEIYTNVAAVFLVQF